MEEIEKGLMLKTLTLSLMNVIVFWISEVWMIIIMSETTKEEMDMTMKKEEKTVTMEEVEKAMEIEEEEEKAVAMEEEKTVEMEEENKVATLDKVIEEVAAMEYKGNSMYLYLRGPVASLRVLYYLVIWTTS